MIRKITKSGGSFVLPLDKTMRDHLGITTQVEVLLVDGSIILRAPRPSFADALEETNMEIGPVLKNLAGGAGAKPRG